MTGLTASFEGLRCGVARYDIHVISLDARGLLLHTSSTTCFCLSQTLTMSPPSQQSTQASKASTLNAGSTSATLTALSALRVKKATEAEQRDRTTKGKELLDLFQRVSRADASRASTQDRDSLKSEWFHRVSADRTDSAALTQRDLDTGKGYVEVASVVPSDDEEE